MTETQQGRHRPCREEFGTAVGLVSPAPPALSPPLQLCPRWCVVWSAPLVPTTFLSKCPLFLASPIACGRHCDGGFTFPQPTQEPHQWTLPLTMCPGFTALCTLDACLHDPVTLALYMPVSKARFRCQLRCSLSHLPQMQCSPCAFEVKPGTPLP